MCVHGVLNFLWGRELVRGCEWGEELRVAKYTHTYPLERSKGDFVQVELNDMGE